MLENVPDLPVQPPVSLLATVKISASGEVLDVIADDRADSSLVTWVRELMQKGWKFHPAILNGQPIESELHTLFQIYAKGTTRFVERDPVLKPVTLIRLLWTRDAYHTNEPNRLTVMYGVLTESTGPVGRPF